MESLQQNFADAAANYLTLKSICEGNVVRWEWASFVLYDPQPFYHERNKIVRGQKLSGEPSEIKSGMNQYGLDAQNRVVVVRQHVTQFPGHVYETFFVETDNRIDGVHFHHRPKKDVINVTRQTFVDGRIVRFERVARRGNSTESYQYEGDHLVSIQSVATSAAPAKETRHTDHITYDTAGNLSTIQRVYENPVQADWPLYQRPKEGQTVEELGRIIKTMLVRQIPNTIRAARIQGPVYCVALYYSSEDAPHLPPVLFVGLEKQRLEWVSIHGVEAKGKVWNVSEFDRSYDDALLLKDVELLAPCNIFNQELAINGDWERARNVLNQVALELNAIDWSEAIAMTDDFIVFAVDTEEVDFKFNLNAAVSVEQLARLTKSGWI